MLKSVGVGFLSRAFSVLSNIIIIPLILKHLSESEFTLWMLFVSFYSLVVIFDFGFSSTISRYYSFILSGVTLKQLYDNDGAENIKKNHIDLQAMQVLNKINSVIFKILICLAFFTLILIYIYYDIVVKLNLSTESKIAWALFSLSIIFQLTSIKYNGLLHGSGNVSIIYRNTIYSTLAFFVFGFFFIELRFPLIGVCLARAFSSLIMLALNALSSSRLNFTRKNECTENSGIEESQYRTLLKRVRSKSLQLGLGGLGNFICNRTTIIVLTSVVAMSNIAGVSFVINLSITILSVSLILMNNAIPNLVRCRALGQNFKLFSLFKRVVILSLLFYSSSYLLMTILLPALITITHSKIELPDVYVLLLCFLIFFIELIQSLSMCFIATSNNVSFTKYQFYTGVCFILICIALNYLGYATLTNVLFAQLAVQCFYNAWKWPLVIYFEYTKIRHPIVGCK